MPSKLALVLAAATFASAQNITVANLTTGANCACTELAATYGDLVITSNASTYTAEATDYWDIRADLLPGCIFMPTDADQVAVKILTPPQFPGSNINGGVLLALNNMTTITIAADNSTFDVSPGNRWVDVYEALTPYGLYAIGGRLKTIGVPGLELIGGFHYLINKYGYAMDNVLSYDVVLGNGTQVVVNSTSNPDLFWALKGGANNYGIVTKFTVIALPIPYISTTIQTFNESAVPAFIDATANFAANNPPDIAAGSVISITYNQTTGEIVPSLLGVQEGTESPPSRFANFSAIPSTLALNNVLTPIEWHSQLDPPNQMFRVQFASKTMKPNSTQLYQIYEAWKSALEDVSDVEGLVPTFVMNTMPASAASVAMTNGVGNTWGLDDTQSYIIFQYSTGWANASDDLRMLNWASKMLDYWHLQNQELELASEFVYMGDAGDFQDPFAGFPLENVQKMREIRDVYDPLGTFKRLNWGGFKLGN
ncbi:FAD-binding domain-containing protein [Mollisia scopiformis]|uniref:FAD-binding domain-containing protein n=1 Tax=Mollisia scopiformis TaxID=149040 RepID=A0A194XB39_MOLSC|nr:FAD-binding domain-containing protein [Mollisia scopiformis]KUJ16972.1 FAD-binding domain-containing protein [Mollisia scopiformis]